MLTELFGRLGKLQKTLDNCGVSAENLIGLMDNIKNGVISGKIAKDVLDEMLETGKTADEIINNKGLKQIDDVEAISKVIDEVLQENKQQVDQYRSGNERLFGFFVGTTLKKMSGKANPSVVNKLLKDKLK
jgi:aspartyl-tRNA(Asn)/glutamyl-tRNA(Gln) amidotransferase subunit B